MRPISKTRWPSCCHTSQVFTGMISSATASTPSSKGFEHNSPQLVPAARPGHPRNRDRPRDFVGADNCTLYSEVGDREESVWMSDGTRESELLSWVGTDFQSMPK